MSDSIKIRRALLSVYDKTGLVEFAAALHEEFGIELISTGGTAKAMKEAGLPVTLVEKVTGFPEMMDGRVKTLHPKIHAGILADRDNPNHMRQLAEQGIEPIDMVVVNLYPFEQTIAKPDCTFEEAIEMIDIGGPCLLRAAAKNHRHVVVVTESWQLDHVMSLLRENDQSGLVAFRTELARQVFWKTMNYDAFVEEWLSERCAGRGHDRILRLFNARSLRYGENPHQSGEYLTSYGDPRCNQLACAVGSATTEVSFNNYADASAALELCAELTRAGIEAPRGLKPAAPPWGPRPAEVAAPRGLKPAAPPWGPRPAEVAAPRGLKPAAPPCADGAVGPGDTVPNSERRGSSPKEEPRASARAVLRTAQGSECNIVFNEPDHHTPTWLLTWTTYGTWLPGDERGFVSRTPSSPNDHTINNLPGTLYNAAQRDLEESARERMHGEPVYLQAEHVGTVLRAFAEAATKHGISLIALSVMPDHTHLLCQAEQDGVTLMQLFKGISSRRMGQTHQLPNAPRWWTKSGSRRFIQKHSNLQPAVEYILAQKNPLFVGSFLDCCLDDGCSSSYTARAEARGSSSEADACGTGYTARAEARGSSCCFIKHTNACGSAVDGDPIEAYRKAYLGDPNAAMGGVLAVNFEVTAEFATAVMETYQRWGKPLKEAGEPYAPGAFFVEVWLAPSFEEEAVRIIRGEVEGGPRKAWGKRVRLLDVGDLSVEPDSREMDVKRIAGGVLMQNRDLVGLNESQWKVVSERQPTDAELDDLRLAWLVCKHTKSNAITVCKDGMLLGNGAGQMSRVMSCRIATWLARENGHAEQLAGAAAASDAFFPFRDGPDILADAGVTALIQPGGSKRDQEVIDAANERELAMVVTGTRHFRH